MDISEESEFGFEQEPQVAVDESGGALAVWRQLEGDYLIQASSKPPGGAWNPPTDISPPGYEQSLEPQVAMNAAGEAVAVWVQLGSERTIMAARRTPQGSWGPADRISVPGHSAVHVDVAIDPAGNAVAVWTQYDETSDYIVEAAVRSPGGGWAPPVELSQGGHNAWGPKAAIDPAGNAVVTWYRWNDAGDTIVQVAEKRLGQDWSEPDDLSTGGAKAHSPELEVSAERAVVIWAREEVVETSVREGGAWQEPVELAGPGSWGPRLDMSSNGSAIAIWSTESEDGIVVEAATLPVGGAWTEPVAVSGPQLVDAAEPRVAIDEMGRALALWRAWNGTAPVIEAASGAIGGGWGGPVTISPPDAWARHPQVAMDSAGNAAAVWKAFEPLTMQAALFDITKPELASVSIPSAVRAGRPASFAAAPFDAWSLLNPVSWSFGDGSAATGSTVVHSFKEAGRFDVTVTVTDAAGHSSTASTRVDVTPALAVADGVAKVRKGKARLGLHCPGSAVCHGSATLARRFVSRKARGRVRSIGKTEFAIPGDTSATVIFPLSPRILKLLAARKRGIRTRLTSDAVESRTVVLKLAAPRRKHRR